MVGFSEFAGFLSQDLQPPVGLLNSQRRFTVVFSWVSPHRVWFFFRWLEVNFPIPSMGWLYIYLHENHKNQANVGKYDGKSFQQLRFFLWTFSEKRWFFDGFYPLNQGKSHQQKHHEDWICLVAVIFCTDSIRSHGMKITIVHQHFEGIVFVMFPNHRFQANPSEPTWSKKTAWKQPMRDSWDWVLKTPIWCSRGWARGF